jgi:hypothetical protein
VELSHYDVLGVPRDADHATLRAAYRRRARQTHPDAGGDEAEFAAVALAWWTLSSPERRARYDAGDVGEDDAWGEDLGWDDEVPAPPPPRRPVPTPTPTPPPDDAGADPAADPAADAGAEDPVAEPGPGPDAYPDAAEQDDGPVDAFTSEPRVLPPATPSGPPVPGRIRDAWFDLTRRRTWTRRRLTVLAVVVALLLAAAPFVVHGAITGDLTGTIPWALAAYAVVLGAGLLVRSGTREDVRVAPYLTAVFLWGPVLLFAAIGTFYLTGGITVARLAVIVLPLAAGVALARDADRRLLVRRAQSELRRRREVQRGLASRWNRLLALRAEHGAAHVEPGQQSGRAVWQLVDDRTGEVLTRTPAGAPLAWARELRALGVPVAPVPRHPGRARAAAA